MAVLIVVGEGVASLSTSSLLETTSLPHLHQVAHDGCCGLLVRRTLSSDFFADMLSLSDATKHDQWKKRFRNPKVALLSTSSTALSLGNSAGFDSIQAVTLKEAGAAARIAVVPTYQLVVVHLHNEDPKLTAIAMDDVFASVPATPSIVRVAVATHSETTIEAESNSLNILTELYSRFLRLCDPPTHVFLPRQSFTRLNGHSVQIQKLPILVAYEGDGHVRRDTALRFTERQCAEYGGNNVLLLDHFFLELAYLLGLTPKYGA